MQGLLFNDGKKETRRYLMTSRTTTVTNRPDVDWRNSTTFIIRPTLTWTKSMTVGRIDGRWKWAQQRQPNELHDVDIMNTTKALNYPRCWYHEYNAGFNLTHDVECLRQRRLLRNTRRCFDVYDDCHRVLSDVVFFYYKDGYGLTIVIIVGIQRHLKQSWCLARHRTLFCRSFVL